MASIRFDEFENDSIVLHFGGPSGSIDANTFALALLGFVRTAHAVSDTIDPDEVVAFQLERMGDGSYRAVVKRVRKEVGGFLSRGVENLFWAVVSTLLINYFAGGLHPVWMTPT